MKELSMHILDIAQNSVRGNAKNIYITIKENRSLNVFEFIIEDDGNGIPQAILNEIKNPFTTSRTTRKVGLGIPLLNDTCIICNGKMDIETITNKGTKIQAIMEYNHIDRPPLGDISSTMAGLITSNEDINIVYTHIGEDEKFEVCTRELKEVLGDISLTEISVFKWLVDYIKENLNDIKY